MDAVFRVVSNLVDFPPFPPTTGGTIRDPSGEGEEENTLQKIRFLACIRSDGANDDPTRNLAAMENVKVQYAKTHLSALLASVEGGQEIVISRGERPVARLVPVEAPGARDLGFVAYRVPDGFFDPLPEEELTAWEGGE